MNIWQKFIVRFFPFNSTEEYNGAKEIHVLEQRIYRKQWQYILGILLFFIPLIALLLKIENWALKLLLLPIIFGEICIRDTISEHFCLKLYKQNKIVGANNVLQRDR
jgi:hypothetical protein